MKRYRRNFEKIVYGYAEVLAESENEARAKFCSEELDDEFDNKSEYEWDEDIEDIELNKIKELMKDTSSFDDLYSELQNNDIGDWDQVNSEDVIKQYITEMMKKDIHVSHIVEAMEKNPSSHEVYNIWLGNSMETPTPINSKKDLLEALGVDIKWKIQKLYLKQ